VRALRERRTVTAVALNLEDTLKVVTGPEYLIEQMRQDGHRLGLLGPEASER
jgi:hypothetical protein